MNRATDALLEALAGSALQAMPWASALIYGLVGVVLGCAVGAMLARRTPIGGAHCVRCGHRLDDRRVGRPAATGDERPVRCPECGGSCDGADDVRWAAGAGGAGIAGRVGVALAVVLATAGVATGIQWPVRLDDLRAARPLRDAEFDELIDRAVRWHWPALEVKAITDEFIAADPFMRIQIIERLTARFAERHDAGWDLASRDRCSTDLGRLFGIEAFSDGRQGRARWRESPLDASFLELVKTFTRRPPVTLKQVDHDAISGESTLGLTRIYAPSFRGLWTSLAIEAIAVDGNALEFEVPTRGKRFPEGCQAVFRVTHTAPDSSERTLRTVWRRTVYHGALNAPERTPELVVHESTFATEQRLRLGPTGLITEGTTDDPRHVGWTAEADRWSFHFVDTGAHQVAELTITPVWFTDAVVYGQWQLEQDGRSSVLGEMAFLLSMNTHFPKHVAALIEPPFDPTRPMTLRFRSAAPSLPRDAHAFRPGSLENKSWPKEWWIPTWEGSVAVGVVPGVSGPEVIVERVRGIPSTTSPRVSLR